MTYPHNPDRRQAYSQDWRGIAADILGMRPEVKAQIAKVETQILRGSDLDRWAREATTEEIEEALSPDLKLVRNDTPAERGITLVPEPSFDQLRERD